MTFSLLLILCSMVFVNAYDEDGWHYEWCSEAGCNISFNLAEGGAIEVLATDYDLEEEHVKVYLDEEYYGDCNPGQQAKHDLWVPCSIPAGSIVLQATDEVNYHQYTDASKGILDAYVVVRIPTNLLGGLSATLNRIQEQIALLVETNLQQAQEIQEQAQEIQELKAAMTNVVTRDSITVRVYGTYITNGWDGWEDTGLSTSKSFCSLTRVSQDGEHGECYVSERYGTWQVAVYTAESGGSQSCKVHCIEW